MHNSVDIVARNNADNRKVLAIIKELHKDKQRAICCKAEVTNLERHDSVALVDRCIEHLDAEVCVCLIAHEAHKNSCQSTQVRGLALDIYVARAIKHEALQKLVGSLFDNIICTDITLGTCTTATLDLHVVPVLAIHVVRLTNNCKLVASLDLTALRAVLELRVATNPYASTQYRSLETLVARAVGSEWDTALAKVLAVEMVDIILEQLNLA